MIENKPKTIDAYMKAAGLRPGSSVTSKNFIPLKARSRSNFVDLMDRMASADVSSDPTKIRRADHCRLSKATKDDYITVNGIQRHH